MVPRHFTYLLRSTPCPARPYIGYTVDPSQRLREHNGELRGGATATRSHRPWRLVVAVSGFRSQKEALAFEFAWQHPSAPPLHRIIRLRGLWSYKMFFARVRAANRGVRRAGFRDAVAWSLRVLELMLGISDCAHLSVRRYEAAPAAEPLGAVLAAAPAPLLPAAPVAQLAVQPVALPASQAALEDELVVEIDGEGGVIYI